MSTSAFNPGRLSLARRRRGLTKRKLAESVGVDSRTVSGWEHGEFDPTEDRLEELSLKLRFPREFFLADDLEEPGGDGVSFRSMTRMTAAQRDMALTAGALAFELCDWIERRFDLPVADVPDMGGGTGPEEAADSVRHAWGLGEEPVKNVVHLLESRGVRVFSLSIDAAEVDAFSLWHRNRPFVFLNTQKSAEHSRFDAAHELGHLVLHRHGSPHGQKAEHEANLFASAFLMPRRSVLAHAPRLPTVKHLIAAKRYWGVSVAALAYRLSALRVITEWNYRSLCIEIAKNGYRKQEPAPMQRETSQVLSKVFASLREEGVGKPEIAADLMISDEEIEALVFGLALTSITSVAQSHRTTRRGSLRLA